jgi:hypothetical protein
VNLAFSRIWSWDQRQKKKCRKPCGWSLEPTEDQGYTNQNNKRDIPWWAVVCVTFLYKTIVRWFDELFSYQRIPSRLVYIQKRQIMSLCKYYFWDTPYLWKFCVDQVVRRCVLQDEFHSILTFCHSYSYGRHFGEKKRPTRYLKVVFIGLLFLRMHITFANHVKNTNEHVISLIRIKCF